MEPIRIRSVRPVETKPIVTVNGAAISLEERLEEEEEQSVGAGLSDFSVVRRAARGLKSVGARGL